VTLTARWVTLRARWVTLRASWVTLRASWVTLTARWVPQTASWVTAKSSLRDAKSSLGDANWSSLRVVQGFSTDATSLPMMVSVGLLRCSALHLISTTELECVTAAGGVSGVAQVGVQLTAGHATVAQCADNTLCTFTPQVSSSALSNAF
jgi:hypothetical protein